MIIDKTDFSAKSIANETKKVVDEYHKQQLLEYADVMDLYNLDLHDAKELKDALRMIKEASMKGLYECKIVTGDEDGTLENIRNILLNAGYKVDKKNDRKLSFGAKSMLVDWRNAH